MKRLGKTMAVLLYLLVMALAFGLKPQELLDLRQLLLVLFGGIILYLPSLEWKRLGKSGLGWRDMDFRLFSRNAIYASYIQTFMLLFLLFSKDYAIGQTENPLSAAWMREAALSLRPLLYGICIWIAFGEADRKQDGGERQEIGTGGTDAGKAEGAGAGQVPEENRKTEWTVQECYQHFRELGLTKREAEVAVQVCKGLGNKEIAMELSISETTVKKHLSNIFEKLGVGKREELMQVLKNR